MDLGKLFSIAVLSSLLVGAAQADDVAKGEKTFNRCKACHAITADDGTNIVKGGKTGPNLYGVIGRTVGSLDGFTYGDSIAAAGAAGIVWDEEQLAAYVADPTDWLEEALGDKSAKSKMTFKLKKGGDHIAAYLATMTPS
ncbi:cytochrome C [Rhodobacteraceae bacterium KMM 6894]|nr:cytochrome C [Rhodobacteraceae bacterium KMM 6894]